MKRIFNSFFFLQIVILLFCASAIFCFVTDYLWCGVLFLLLTLCFIAYLYRIYRQPVKNISFLLDAIENDDSAICFSETNQLHYSAQVNKMLNRITQILYTNKQNIVQREKYYELILDFVDIGIIVLGQKGIVYQTNKAALRLLGLPVLTHTSQLRILSDTLTDQFDQLRPDNQFQIDIANQQGTVHLALRVSGVILKNEELRIVSLNNINRELDEREIDAWLKLTRVLTHEIMNSLTPVTSISETLLTLPDVVSREMKQGLETICSTGKGLINFVNSYRQLTHIPQPNPSLFDVQPFLERMIHLASHHADNHNVTITLTHVDAELMLYADEQLLGQVVTNLLTNALQALETQVEGEIKLQAYCDDQQGVVIEIINNGPKINTDEANQIFVPFFTTKANGCGIGLSLSRQIMRQCGGTLILMPYKKSDAWTTFLLRIR